MYYRSLFLLVLTFLCLKLTGQQNQTVTDADGNIYFAVTIGKQIWLGANLKTTKFNDGKPIPLVSDDDKWKTLNTPAYCWLNNDISNKDVYGALYNWYAVNTKKLCPKGWHVPTDQEWGLMIDFLGDQNTAGNKLKEAGSEHWKISEYDGTDDFDFTALPGGMRYDKGTFPIFANNYAVWWSATGIKIDAWNRGLFFSSSRTFRGHESMRSGFSVRCIRD